MSRIPRRLGLDRQPPDGAGNEYRLAIGSPTSIRIAPQSFLLTPREVFALWLLLDQRVHEDRLGASPAITKILHGGVQ